MKKILILIFITIFIFTGCSKQKNEDAIQFKEEYEQYNEKVNGNQKYMKVNIQEDNPIKYVKYQELIQIIKNKTGIIYFGFPECPWCRNVVPVLLETAEEFGIDTIYYYNALSIRDKKHLDEDGNIIIDEEGTEEYKKLVELLYDYLGPYEGLNDDTIKRLYFPTVLFVREGKIIGIQVSTVDSQENPYINLTKEQHDELKQIYSDYINKTYDILCDEAC